MRRHASLARISRKHLHLFRFETHCPSLLSKRHICSYLLLSANHLCSRISLCLHIFALKKRSFLSRYLVAEVHHTCNTHIHSFIFTYGEHFICWNHPKFMLWRVILCIWMGHMLEESISFSWYHEHVLDSEVFNTWQHGLVPITLIFHTYQHPHFLPLLTSRRLGKISYTYSFCIFLQHRSRPATNRRNTASSTTSSMFPSYSVLRIYTVFTSVYADFFPIILLSNVNAWCPRGKMKVLLSTYAMISKFETRYVTSLSLLQLTVPSTPRVLGLRSTKNWFILPEFLAKGAKYHVSLIMTLRCPGNGLFLGIKIAHLQIASRHPSSLNVPLHAPVVLEAACLFSSIPSPLKAIVQEDSSQHLIVWPKGPSKWACCVPWK